MLVAVPLVLLSAVVTYEATAGRSLASWFLGEDYWDYQALKTSQPATFNVTAADGEQAVVPIDDGDGADGGDTEETFYNTADEHAAADSAAEAEADSSASESAADADREADSGSGDDSVHEEADALRQWKLMHSMMYWAHSNPVPSELPQPIYVIRVDRVAWVAAVSMPRVTHDFIDATVEVAHARRAPTDTCCCQLRAARPLLKL